MSSEIKISNSGESAESQTFSSSSTLSSSGEEKKDIRLELFLKELELEKYLTTFQVEEVTYRILLEMEEKDLQDLGIPFGISFFPPKITARSSPCFGQSDQRNQVKRPRHKSNFQRSSLEQNRSR